MKGLVKEHINFERGRNPLDAMNLGKAALIPSMCQEMIELDAKFKCYVRAGLETRGLIRFIEIHDDEFKVDCFSDVFVDIDNNEIGIINYSIDLICEVGLDIYLDMNSVKEDHNSNVKIKIKPEFKNFFKDNASYTSSSTSSSTL